MAEVPLDTFLTPSELAYLHTSDDMLRVRGTAGLVRLLSPSEDQIAAVANSARHMLGELEGAALAETVQRLEAAQLIVTQRGMGRSVLAEWLDKLFIPQPVSHVVSEVATAIVDLSPSHSDEQPTRELEPQLNNEGSIPSTVEAVDAVAVNPDDKPPTPEPVDGSEPEEAEATFFSDGILKIGDTERVGRFLSTIQRYTHHYEVSDDLEDAEERLLAFISLYRDKYKDEHPRSLPIEEHINRLFAYFEHGRNEAARMLGISKNAMHQEILKVCEAIAGALDEIEESTPEPQEPATSVPVPTPMPTPPVVPPAKPEGAESPERPRRSLDDEPLHVQLAERYVGVFGAESDDKAAFKELLNPGSTGRFDDSRRRVIDQINNELLRHVSDITDASLGLTSAETARVRRFLGVYNEGGRPTSKQPESVVTQLEAANRRETNSKNLSMVEEAIYSGMAKVLEFIESKRSPRQTIAEVLAQGNHKLEYINGRPTLIRV